MPSHLKKILLFTLFFSPICMTAAYQIKGKVNMKGQWQNQIYLATIDKLDDYYSANSEFVINVAEINEKGEFLLKGDNLPDRKQYYRIYLLKEEHSEFNACLYHDGEEHNFIHLILHNDSNLEITADSNAFAPFGDYIISGDTENELMKELTAMIYPSYFFYEIKFPSELRFSKDKLMKDLFVFSDTCSSPLVSLAALNNTDYDGYFAYHTDTYEAFAERLNKEIPAHPYTRDYKRKLRYYADDYDSQKDSFFKILSGLLGALSLFLAFLLFKQNRNSKNKEDSKQEPIKAVAHFTPQELKILAFIKEGKSNKEIASDLYIEVSTVKSHINKLYGKLNVKNRRQAIAAAEKPEFQGL